MYACASCGAFVRAKYSAEYNCHHGACEYCGNPAITSSKYFLSDAIPEEQVPVYLPPDPMQPVPRRYKLKEIWAFAGISMKTYWTSLLCVFLGLSFTMGIITLPVGLPMLIYGVKRMKRINRALEATYGSVNPQQIQVRLAMNANEKENANTL